MAILVRVRTASKRHRCNNGDWIEPGERYEDVALTPDSNPDCGKWWHARQHPGGVCWMYADEPQSEEEPW
jgi:hypothetical protein